MGLTRRAPRLLGSGDLYDGEVTALDTAASVGEMLAWIGLGAGLPLLVIAWFIRLLEGHWDPQEITIIERHGDRIARWFAAGDFHERPLHQNEQHFGDGWHEGVVSSASPHRARLNGRPHAQRLFWTLGAVFAGIGLIGAVVSFLPAFV